MDFPAIFSKTKEWEYVIILSYDMHPISFFETEILNKLKVNKNITVAIDYNNYKKIVSDNEFASNYLGIYYNLEPVKVRRGGKFHPKFYFSLAGDKAEIFLGSVNLTQSGFKRNYECLLSFYFDLDDIDEESIDFLMQIANFLENVFINPNNLIEDSNDSIKTSINDILQSHFFLRVKELHTSMRGRFKRTYHFLHNTQESLFKQIEPIIGGSIETFQVLSPFFDSDVEMLIDIRSKCKNIDIYIPRSNSTFPVSAFMAHQAAFDNVSIFTVEKEDLQSRFIHSKIYEFNTENQSFQFITSGNFTKPGFYNDDYPRNFEIGVLFSEGQKLLDHADLVIKPVTNIGDIITDEREDTETQSSSLPFDMESAFYREEKINITFDKDFIQKATINDYEISLMLNGIEENRYPISSSYNIKPSLEIEGSQSIKIQLFSRDPHYKSVPIIVSREKHDPNLLPTLGASAFNNCVRAGGVEGLEKAFEYAKASGREDWMLYLLSHWNLERILQGVDEDAERSDGDIDIVPTFRLEKKPKSPQKRIRKNMSAVLGCIDMQKNISDFLDSLKKDDDSFEDYVLKYIKYGFVFFFEINTYFREIIKREEIKKDKSPNIVYPEYTWGHNYNKLYSYIFLICKNLNYNVLTNDIKKMSDNLKFELISNIFLWTHLNTDKTNNELRSNKYFIKFEEFVNSIADNIKYRINEEVFERVYTIFEEHNISTDILNRWT